jgi:hypothetical protein
VKRISLSCSSARRRPVVGLDLGGEPDGGEIVAGALLPALCQAAIAFEKEVRPRAVAVCGAARVRRAPGRAWRVGRRPGGGEGRVVRGILGSEIAAEGGDAEAEARRQRRVAEEVESEGIVVGHWEVSLAEGVRAPAEQVRPGDRRRGLWEEISG